MLMVLEMIKVSPFLEASSRTVDRVSSYISKHQWENAVDKQSLDFFLIYSKTKSYNNERSTTMNIIYSMDYSEALYKMAGF